MILQNFLRRILTAFGGHGPLGTNVRRFPVLARFQGYKPDWLGSDISAGLAIAAVGLPKKHKNDNHPGDVAAGSAEAKKERKRAYEKEIARLQVEIAYLQSWVQASGARIVIIFEGRDAAGKGGVIRRFVERVSPRVFSSGGAASTE